MKKLFIGLAPLLPLGAAFAEDVTNSGVTYTGSTAESIVTQASGTITNFLTGVGPTVATIIGAGLAIWVGIRLVGLLKSAFSAGKGR